MDIDKAVINNVNHTFFSADTDKFLQTFLNVPSTCIDEVYDKLKATHFPNNRWKEFPQPGALENKYYAPFTQIAKDISDAVKASRDYRQSIDAERVAGTWVHSPNEVPKSSKIPLMADSRPDCMFITSSPTINEVNSALDENIEGNVNAPVSETEEESVKKQKKKAELDIWWRHVHVPVEIKRYTRVEDWEGAYLQLGRYMQHVLAEQLDRRSLFGIVLCCDQLVVVASNRSGLTKMFEPINIHKDAKKFIQVIASFTYMPAHRIGWDPSMEIYDPTTDQHWPSYDVGIPSEVLQQSKYTTHWCIKIPNPTDKEEEVMITIKVLSAVSSEVMVGRATLVWEAIKYEKRWIDMAEFDKIDIYVIKRYWRPLGKDESPPPHNASIPPEAERYNRCDDKEERLYFAGDILIDGQLDSTEKHIHEGVEHIVALPLHLSPNQTTVVYAPEDSVAEESSMHKATVPLPPPPRTFKPSKINAFIPRVHTQVIIPFTGGRLRHFKSRLELIEVILAAVRDHEKFYRAGVVHRDISIGNIVITSQTTAGSYNSKNTKGRLIDLDHAKSGTPMRPPTPYEPTEDELKSFMSSLGSLHRIDAPAPLSFDKEVGRKVMQTILDLVIGIAYARDIANIRKEYFGRNINPGHTITLTDLGWDKETHTTLDFSARTVGSGGRTGTLPYMSAEVLATKRFSGSHVPVKQPFFHDAVHDIESFMWVVANICMTRKGPGIDALRDELRPGFTDDNKDIFDDTLKDTVHAIFDSPDETVLMNKKSSFFTDPALMDSVVVNHFHPYFKSLGPMVLRWWNILVIAYKYREYEYRHIHAHVIDILEQTINDLKKPAVSKDEEEERKGEKEAEEKEKERRKKLRYHTLLPFFTPQRVLRP